MTASSSEPPAEGWDLSALGDRICIEPPTWDFDGIVAAHARGSADLLDIDTGGGEWLAALPERPARTVATESWPPNVPIAEARLRRLGVTVVAAASAPDNVEQVEGDSHRLPFPADSFSLVTARHTSFVAAEVARVLRRGGTFLTQQVGGDYGDFYDALGLPRPRITRRWTLALASQQLAGCGLDVVDGAEGTETTRFADVGALEWYLRLIPWTVDQFSAADLEHAAAKMPLCVRLPAFWLKATLG